jgi:hypothetical protein
MPGKSRIWCALVHYPVLDREGNVVTTSVTNMDVHDMSRACKTYGVGSLVVTTPIDIHREMVEKVAAHWQDPFIWKRTPSRRHALELVRVVESIEAASALMEREGGGRPDIIGTTAKRCRRAISYETLKKQIIADPQKPRLLVFGTGWGLAPQAMDMCGCILEPVEGAGEYCHLSVRSAAAIILDRLLGKK